MTVVDPFHSSSRERPQEKGPSGGKAQARGLCLERCTGQTGEAKEFPFLFDVEATTVRPAPCCLSPQPSLWDGLRHSPLGSPCTFDRVINDPGSLILQVLAAVSGSLPLVPLLEPGRSKGEAFCSRRNSQRRQVAHSCCPQPSFPPTH